MAGLLALSKASRTVTRAYARAGFAAIIFVSLLLFSMPAQATTAIYYSAPENTYGWCAGYASGKARDCAKRNCVNTGGKACKLALECRGGWSAVASAQRPAVGLGASCGMNDPSSARQMALASCIEASNALCWTVSTFSGNSTSSAQSNRAFDEVWFSQALLSMRKYSVGNADGNIGARTRVAIKKFQTTIGMPANGEVGDELLGRLFDAVGGRQQFIRIIKRDVLEPRKKRFARQIFAHAPSPLPEKSFGQELVERTQEQRLLALATFLAAAGIPCTPPAYDALQEEENLWVVDCDEDYYEVDTLAKTARKVGQ